MSKTYRLLTPADILDIYGCEWIMQATDIDLSDRQMISFRLNEIKDAYVAIGIARIKAEAQFLGVDLDCETSIKDIKAAVRKALEKSIEDKIYSGKPVNLFAEIVNAHKMGNTDMSKYDMSRFKSITSLSSPQERKKDSVEVGWFSKDGNGRVDDSRWTVIADAFLRVEEAHSDASIVAAIDALNDLQHNSFHIIIDFQNGRMLEQVSNVEDPTRVVKDILDLKANARSPFAFANKMSKDIRDMLMKYKPATIRSTN